MTTSGVSASGVSSRCSVQNVASTAAIRVGRIHHHRVRVGIPDRSPSKGGTTSGGSRLLTR